MAKMTTAAATNHGSSVLRIASHRREDAVTCGAFLAKGIGSLRITFQHNNITNGDEPTMSYQPISIPEAMENLNKTWYLPYVQRSFVWGSRFQAEKYVCLLFDSLLRGYPIGGLILWATSTEVPFREFMKDYDPDETARIVDKGRFGERTKLLVYDGQQRLQTLYSCLLYTFKNRSLCVDVTYDLNMSADEREAQGIDEETPFEFFDSREEIAEKHVRMSELYVTRSTEDKVALRQRIQDRPGLAAQKLQVEVNIEKLWNVFCNTQTKPLAYFPVEAGQERIVNDIFNRINTGGVPLTNTDIFFAKVKEVSPYFEQRVTTISKRIFNTTKYRFQPDEILQLLQYIMVRTTRVDFERVGPKRVNDFIKKFETVSDPIHRFFSDFLCDEFGIDNAAIVPRRIALLPLILFSVEASCQHNLKYANLSGECKRAMKKYFIVSQINDWNIDTIARMCAEEIEAAFKRVSVDGSVAKTLKFPFDEIAAKIDLKNRRPVEVRESTYAQYKWFGLKVLMPRRRFVFDYELGGRFNPEIDHIFPKTPKNASYRNEPYKLEADVIWNMQPIKGDKNIQKYDEEPQSFFSTHSELIEDYDYLPSRDMNDPIWSMARHNEFIAARRKLMISALRDLYGIELIQSPEPT